MRKPKGSSKMGPLLIVLILGAVIGIYVYYNHQSQNIGGVVSNNPSAQVPITTQNTNPSKLPSGWKVYTNPFFHLSLGYPSTWTGGSAEDNKSASFSGHGFFHLTWTENDDIDNLIEIDRYSRSNPFGSHPTITKLSIDGHDARLIDPSSDSNSNYIFLYETCSGTCHSLLFESDKENAMKIINTMKFTE